MLVFRRILAVLACAALVASAPAPAPRALARASAAQPFVIAANPLAAAIAVQAMLSLVEPQSSGVGGGAFMTYYDGRTGKVSVYDGREVAPAQAMSTMFLDPAGKPLPFNTAVLSGRATGVPGAVKMLSLAHDE